MGKLYIIMGKSATGKDTIYKRLMEQRDFPLKRVIGYTTRPIRRNETNGVEYFFRTGKELEQLRAAGRVIELRTYYTILGEWHYFTVDDGQIDLENQDYLLISTLAGYEQLQNYYGRERVVPLYIEAGDKERLLRSIRREDGQRQPNYAEVCRRYLADETDFAETELERLGIDRRYRNDNLERCLEEIREAVAHGY